MSNDVGWHPIFEAWSGHSHSWGPGDRYSISFGGGVLDTVASGLDDYLRLGPWRSFRRSSAVLGCVPWLTDAEIVNHLLRFDASCIVTNKPESFPNRSLPHRELVRLNAQGPGFPLDSLAPFDWLAPRVDGQPATLGPFDDPRGKTFSSVRVAGVSQRPTDRTLPLVHAKILLLGEVTYSDEGPIGDVGDYFFFTPRRLWLGSSNLTFNSRRSLEFGMWSDDVALMDHATGFLVDLLTYSEPFESQNLSPKPEMAPFDFDDEAMAEYAAEFGYEPDDE